MLVLTSLVLLVFYFLHFGAFIEISRLKVFSYSFSIPQGLGVSEDGGRADINMKVVYTKHNRGFVRYQD